MDKKPEFNIVEILSFLNYFYELKETKRTGWKTKLRLESSESVAEHTLLMIVFALVFSEYGNYSPIKTLKMVKMILIHDLGESIIGDYAPKTIDWVKKKHLENNAMIDIISKIPWIAIKHKYLKIWKEYAKNKTTTSKLIHLIDKLEMALQAKYYSETRENINKDDIRPFLRSASEYVLENHKTKNNKNDNKDIANKEIEEIEQIILYLCK
jgi:putative hydrolase of HD superfamily